MKRNAGKAEYEKDDADGRLFAQKQRIPAGMARCLTEAGFNGFNVLLFERGLVPASVMTSKTGS
jgi:hypothetical protein